MANQSPEPAFVRHLRKLVESGTPLSQTKAQRHHYVPSFLLARWATPQKREGRLAVLTVATGRTETTKPDNVAFVGELYSLHDDDGVLDRKIETFMSIIEGHAADPIKRLGTAPQSIADEDRWTIAFFLALQQGRTPPGLADHRRLAEFAAREFLRSRRAKLDDFEAVAAAYRRTINPTAGDKEIRSFAEAQKKKMPDPDGPVQTTPEAAFQSLSLNVSQIALTVAALDWTVLTTDEEFIENDRGMAMWDPNLPATRGNMWASSATAETTVPLAPGACLKLTPGGSRYAVASADTATVDAINLRTYGWAAQKIFGTTTSVVAGLHAKVQADSESVPAPVAPKVHYSGPRPA
ncbi:DUF4238 domain-containing protein [Solirubrobacter sp. CPCC 204708]|uniref:DUF4238 domain-containing protein n=1 Tax=Solirubrobacter deserti TaxID=2282478 RepID=A0ABT4RND4_9ACTN|nr:DUF4238 domain-containing protein [Solirubrobacter deserti]MBE2318399.1 DUF4238 domain-containing protein [Solirubrobacter deserti]MDA0140082.1 DUF4238 domain-containing protein [Solirubrobacter deserti]